VPDCRNYLRPELSSELETILHYFGFVEFMVALQPSFNSHADIASHGSPELHLQYMQLAETRRRCRDSLRLLDGHYTVYKETDRDFQSPKSISQWAAAMMAGTATELKENIALAKKQGRTLFNESMNRLIMLSNLARVTDTWSLTMGPRTGWWGSLDWPSASLVIRYTGTYSVSNGPPVPPQGWINGDDTFKRAFGMARAMKAKGLVDELSEEEQEQEDAKHEQGKQERGQERGQGDDEDDEDELEGDGEDDEEDVAEDEDQLDEIEEEEHDH
jgi:hypothetical protein